MLSPGAKTKGSDHEIVILAHLVQMVKVVRKVRDEDLAQALGVSPGEAAQMLSESAKPTFEQLRKLFLAVGMATDGIFESHSGQPERTVLTADGFGNAIERGLVILNEADPDEDA
jgi:transcriptional regulator with XRE-family HTH domain